MQFFYLIENCLQVLQAEQQNRSLLLTQNLQLEDTTCLWT